MNSRALAALTARFHAQIAGERLHPGAALAVYQHGRLVLDLVAGLADTQSGWPVQQDTLFQLRSAGKPFASVALLQQLERGRAELDAPVAAYWPAFGALGKDRVTLRHTLCHRGGFADLPFGLPWQQWIDREAVARALEALPLVFEPGTASAYHALTQQWVCAELVSRLDGRAFSAYLRDEITEPLGMLDTYVGLPAELERRVAKVHLTEAASADAAATVRLLNRPHVHQVPAPVFGLSTARDMARFFAAIAAGGALDGVRILQVETVAAALAVAVDGEFDRTLLGPVRRGLGFNLGGLYAPAARMTGAASTASTFYHDGAGTVLCWADPDLGLAMAFLQNGYRPAKLEFRPDANGRPEVVPAAGDTGMRRDRMISDAVRALARSAASESLPSKVE